VKGLEKLTTIRLAEVLSQRNSVSTEAITDALAAQDKSGETFVDLLIGGGHITEWDLAKIVVEHFQMPFVMASNYDISIEVQQKLPDQIVFKHNLVPLDVFGNLLILAMPILTPFEMLDKLQKKHAVDIYPYVGLPSENRKVLTESFKGYKAWKEKEEAERERREREKKLGKVPAGAKKDSGDWMNIFDAADQAVRQAQPQAKPKT
jgi:hypothetical protein